MLYQYQTIFSLVPSHSKENPHVDKQGIKKWVEVGTTNASGIHWTVAHPPADLDNKTLSHMDRPEFVIKFSDSVVKQVPNP